MSQIYSNTKDDFQVVLLLSCFVGHPVYYLICNFYNVNLLFLSSIWLCLKFYMFFFNINIHNNFSSEPHFLSVHPWRQNRVFNLATYGHKRNMYNVLYNSALIEELLGRIAMFLASSSNTIQYNTMQVQ